MIVFRILDCCCSDSFGRRPPMRPSSEAASNPALFRPLNMARSMPKSPSFGLAVIVVSIASVKQTVASPPELAPPLSTARMERQPFQYPDHKHVTIAHLIQRPGEVLASPIVRRKPSLSRSAHNADFKAAGNTSSFETNFCDAGRPVFAGLRRTVQNLPAMRQ